MRIDRTHIPWALFVLLVSVVAAVLFAANFHPESLPIEVKLPAFFGATPPIRNTYGGTPLGLIFGSVAFAIFLFASALGIRKKKRLWRIGNVQFWLKAHIWLTILTVPLILFHSGFHFGGPHTSWLMMLYLFVMGSGFFGLGLQQFMPMVMKERLPREVVFEQIPHIKQRLVGAAEEMDKLLGLTKEAAQIKPAQPAAAAAGVESASGTAAAPVATAVVSATGDLDPSLVVVREFLLEECLPYLRLRRGERHRLGDQRTSDAVFRLLKLNVLEIWRPKVEDMQDWCDDRRMMDLQLRLHHWLHGWLLVHVPTSFALLLFTAWHAWVAVRFLVAPIAP